MHIFQEKHQIPFFVFSIYEVVTLSRANPKDIRQPLPDVRKSHKLIDLNIVSAFRSLLSLTKQSKTVNILSRR